MVKIGIVGLGFMGKMHAQAYSLLPDAKVSAVADSDSQRRRDMSVQYEAEEYGAVERMLAHADVDVVDVCLPTNLHRRVVQKAAAAGKHVFCEKPIALTLRDADAMIAACQEAGVKFMVGHVLRFWPEYTVIKDMVDARRLGAIHSITASRLSPPPDWGWKDWFSQPKLSGGAVVDLHIHDLDMIAWLIGAPQAVFAGGLKNEEGALQSVWTTGTGHGDGAVSFAQGSLAMPRSFPFTMTLIVSGERGTIEFNSRLNPPLTFYRVDGEPEHPPVPDLTGGAQSAEAVGNIQELGGYFAEIKYFVDCIERDRWPQVVTPEDARLALALCLAARASAEKGRPIRL
jgi:UDP-N-acetylglucosamine 3-dehydrogenase